MNNSEITQKELENETIDIDLNEYSKNELITLIQLSVDSKIPIDQLLVKMLKDFIDKKSSNI